MKKIIDGKMYNTETAKELCSDGFSNRGDFSYWKDILYVTKKGQYFFHGEGGPRSQYAENIGNNTTSGSESMWLVDDVIAREYIMENDVELATKLFGEEIEEG